MTVTGEDFTFDDGGLSGGTVNFLDFELISTQRMWRPIANVELRGVSIEVEDLKGGISTLAEVWYSLQKLLDLPSDKETLYYLETELPTINAIYSEPGDSVLRGSGHVDILIGGSEVTEMRGFSGTDILITSAHGAQLWRAGQ